MDFRGKDEGGGRRGPESGATRPDAVRRASRAKGVVPDVTFERAPLRRVLDDASEQVRRDTRAELVDIITHRRFAVVLQAIADLRTGDVVGHEALCRGPGGTVFETAEYLFASGHELDLAHELDRACRDAILQSPLDLEGDLLFLNVLPDTLAAGLVSVREIEDGLSGVVAPESVVLELSERIPLEQGDADELRRRVQPFRDAGFRLAMDDIGAGYWTLRQVPAIEPHFLKADRSLVRDVHLSATRQDAIAAIVMMAAEHGAEVICEGIEQEAEFDAILELGARYGQGFLLAAPAPSPQRHVRFRGGERG